MLDHRNRKGFQRAWGGLDEGNRTANRDDGYGCTPNNGTKGFSDTTRNGYVESHDWLIFDEARM
jgi:hypothetical protein